MVEFEQSEFVSREPIANESEKEVKGKAGPLSRTSSALQLPTLGANGGGAGISKAFENALKARVAAQGLANGEDKEGPMTPRPMYGNGATTPGGGLFGTMSGYGLGATMSPHNPVWKHEVSL